MGIQRTGDFYIAFMQLRRRYDERKPRFHAPRFNQVSFMVKDSASVVCIRCYAWYSIKPAESLTAFPLFARLVLVAWGLAYSLGLSRYCSFIHWSTL